MDLRAPLALTCAALFFACDAHSGAYVTDRDRLTAWSTRAGDTEIARDLAAYDPREDYSIYDQYLTRCIDSAFTMRSPSFSWNSFWIGSP